MKSNILKYLGRSSSGENVWIDSTLRFVVESGKKVVGGAENIGAWLLRKIVTESSTAQRSK